MAGAAQAIGWILQVDDQVSGVLDNLATKAVKTGRAIANSVFDVKSVETLVDMLRPMFVDLQETIAKLKPTVQQVRETSGEAGDIFGKGWFASWNRLFFRTGVFLKGLQVFVWNPIKWFIGIPLRAIKGVLRMVQGILNPFTTIIKSAFFKIFQDILSAVSFALMPVFMQLRMLLIPFIVIFMPMLTRMAMELLFEYVIPFIQEWMPKVQKAFKRVFEYVTTAFKDPSKAWKMFKDDMSDFWKKTLKPQISDFWKWFKGDGLTQLEKWADSLMKWASKDAMPTVQKTVSGWFEGGSEGAPKGGIMGEIFDVVGRLFGVFVKTVGSLLAPLGVALIEFGKGTWKLLKSWLKDKITDFGFWVRDEWPGVKAWLLEKIGEFWEAAGDEALKILPEGAATLLGFKKTKVGKITGQPTVEIAKYLGRLKRKEAAGTLTIGDAGQLKRLRSEGILQGLQHGGLVRGSSEGQLVVVGEKGTTEGVIPFGKDVPEADAVRMMQSAVMAASMSKGGAAGAGGGDAVSVLKAIENTLLLIADNTEDSSWMNDPDFDQSKNRKPWQT